MRQTNNVALAIRSAATLTESTFVPIGETLGASIEILTRQAERFEVVLQELNGENLGPALKALSRTATLLTGPDFTSSGGGIRFDDLLVLADAVSHRIMQMAASLGDVDALAINARIAAAHIQGAGVDFSGFANEIGRTLTIARHSLASFSAELRTVRANLAEARTGQLAFERHREEAARSIAQRLTATVEIIARQNQRATRATVAVRQRSVNVRRRIGEAVMALQIGDITRQRLEHSDYALGLEDGNDANLIHRLISAQCFDTVRAFDREVGTITASLSSLAEEARALWTLGGSAYGASDRGGDAIISGLEGQVAEALALFERFEAERAEVAGIMAAVADATASLRDHLRNVQSLETDIRIMGLNTTFKCARIGREGLALSLIAQELRTYAAGFAKEAGALVREVETISTMTGSLVDGTDGVTPIAAGMREIQESASTLRRVDEILDNSLVDLKRDSEQVVALLTHTVADLAARDEIGRMVRQAAESLATEEPDPGELTPATERMLALIEGVYTMVSERAVHEAMFGRVVASTVEVEDVFF